MKKVSKETKREQRYNASLHNLFVKAQKEINANEQYGRNLCPSDKKKILGHYLELNPNYNNGVQRNQQPDSKVHKGKRQSKGNR